MLACGGFEANAEWRTRYLGPGWDLAKVRGTRFNTGDGIRMALDIGAMPYGNWSGCHAVGWDMNAPEFGDLAVGDQFPEALLSLRHHGQRAGRALRRRGRRFPQLHLCQIRPRDPRAAEPVRLADLRPEGDAPAARRIPHPPRDQGHAPTRSRSWRKSSKASIRRSSCRPSRNTTRPSAPTSPFNPNVKDGRGARRARRPEINWANTIDAAAVRGLCRDLRPHLHLRRAAHHHRRRGGRTSTAADPRPLRRGRAGRRAVLFQLSRRHGPDVGRRLRPHRRRQRGARR